MAEVWRRRVIDFHSQPVNGGRIRGEFRTEGDLTELDQDNKQPQHQSRQDGVGGRGRKMKEIGSDKKRQRGYEAPQQPPEKSSVRRGLTHGMLHRGTAISTSMSDARPRSASPLYISQITKSTSVSQVQQVKQQNTLSHICERECGSNFRWEILRNTLHVRFQVINTSREPGDHRRPRWVRFIQNYPHFLGSSRIHLQARASHINPAEWFSSQT